MADVNDQTQPEVQPSEPVPGTPEYDKAMADKYVEANTPESVEEPATPAEETPTEQPEEAPEKAGLKIEKQEEASSDEQVEEAPAAIPADLFDTASNEFASTGALTDETVEGFIKAGIPREFVDTYVEGARALQAQLVSEAQGLVGGEDNWNAMMAWAKNLPESDIEAFNEAVTNPKTSALAIQGLYSRYATENGSEARSVASGAERGAMNGDVYGSKAEMTADMRDPKYKTDAAFRTTVEQKIARSRKAGTLGPLGVSY